MIRNNLISRRLCLPPEVSVGLDGMDDFPETDCAAAESGTADMNDLIFRQPSLPPGDVSTAVDYDTGMVGPDDLIFRRLSFPPDELAGGQYPAADAGDALKSRYMIFRHTNLPPNEFSAGRNGDYIWLNSGTGLSVCAIPVTGSLRFGYPRGGLLSLHCQTTVIRVTPDICYSHHAGCFERYVIRSSIIVVLLIWYCSGVFRIRAMASDGLPDTEQVGPSGDSSGPLPGTFLGPALDVRSEYLYELGPDICIPDVMGLRVFRPDVAAVKVMSVRDSRCIRVVALDDHVKCGYHEILLHDMGEEELVFVSLWTISVVPGRGLYLHL